jgi:ferritin-like protein
MDLEGRHPSTASIGRFFSYDHLPPRLQEVSKECHDLAGYMTDALPDDPELVAGLRKLVEAKDCFVRLAATLKE